MFRSANVLSGGRHNHHFIWCYLYHTSKFCSVINTFVFKFYGGPILVIN